MITNLLEKLNWDKVGILLSGLCALHCLLIPVLLTLLPLWSIGFTIHEWAHPLFLALILPTIVLAIKKSESDKTVKLLLFTGMSLLILALLLHDWTGHTVETIITLIGTATLITGHWKNYKQHSAQACSNEIII
ncbi:MAG: MerC family mercury resistance protein [Bacteroidetes bacterium]|jgi:predicted membrane protein|nr:MerC family mercury resistance protein [Bacteroidota bacterium]